MTRNEKSLRALFNSNEPGWCFIFGTDKASVFEKDGRYMVEYSYGNQVSDPEYFNDEETAKEYAIDLSQSRRPIKSSVRMIRHYSVQVYLPFTQYNGSPYNFNGIQVNDWGVRLEGSAGGSYAAESTNIDIYNDGTISVYDTKHHLDKTKYYNLELIHDFLNFFKENIDITSYLNEPTATGMVSLSSADTYKIKEWADAHKSVRSSRRPIKSDVIIKFEYKDKKYGNPNVKYTQTAIYPSVNEFKKIMDKNNTEFKIIRVTPLK